MLLKVGTNKVVLDVCFRVNVMYKSKDRCLSKGINRQVDCFGLKEGFVIFFQTSARIIEFRDILDRIHYISSSEISFFLISMLQDLYSEPSISPKLPH